MRAETSTHGGRAVLRGTMCRAALVALLVALPSLTATAQLTTDVRAGQPFAGEVSAPAEADSWRFEALAGTTFSARVRAKGKQNELRPTLVLRDLGGGGDVDISDVLVGLGKKTVRIKSTELPTTGMYELVVSGLESTSGVYDGRTKLKIPKALRSFNELISVPAEVSDVDVSFLALSGSTVTGSVKMIDGASSTAQPSIVALTTPLGSGPIDAFTKTKPKSVTFKKVPLDALGTYTLTSTIGTNGGTIRVKGKVKPPKKTKGVVGESSTEELLSLTAYPPLVAFDALGQTRQLSVAGSTPLAVFDLSGASFGTQYTSSDESVATVDTAGVVTSVGDGSATIDVVNGPGTTTITVAVDAAPRLLSVTPRNDERDVMRSRDIVLTFSTALDDATIDADSIALSALGGQVLAATRHTSANGRRVTLFTASLLPASATITVHIDGDALRSTDGEPVDVDGDGLAGGLASVAFTTTSDALVPGTAACLRVFASSLDGQPGAPLAGVSVAVEGTAIGGKTDALGNLRLEPLPAGRVVALIDGTAAKSGSFGRTKVTWSTVAGMELSVDDVFLTLTPAGSLVDVGSEDTTIVAGTSASPLAALTSLEVPAHALFTDALSFGGSLGALPTSSDLLPIPRPDALAFPFVVSVPTAATDGALDAPTNFDAPVGVTLPGASDGFSPLALEPGAHSALWRYDEDAAHWVIDGPLVADDDGSTLASPEGTGLHGPGWFGAFDGALLDAKLELDDTAFDCESPFADLLDVSVTDALVAALDAQGATLQLLATACDADDAPCLVTFDERVVVAHIPGAIDPRDILRAALENPNDFAADDTFDELAQLTWRPSATPTAPALGDLIDIATAAGVTTYALTGLALEDADNASFTISTVSLGGAVADVAGSRTIGFSRLDDGVIAFFTRGAEARLDNESAREALLTSSETWEAFVDGATTRLATSFGALVVDRDADVALTNGVPVCPPDDVPSLGAPAATWVRVDTLRAADGTPPSALIEQTLTSTFTSIALPGDASYVVSAYDPVSRRHGVLAGTTPSGGDRIDVTLALAFIDTVDSDGDGLGDVPEVIVGTDPHDFDTDGDGVGDGVEIDNGTDPFDGLDDETGIIASISTLGTALDIDARNGLAAVADGLAGVALFNIFTGNSPLQVGAIAGGEAVAVALGDGVLAVAELPDRVRLFDVSQVDQIDVLGDVVLPGTPRALAAAGRRIFAGTATGAIVAIDAEVGTATATTLVDEPVHDVVVDGEFLFALGDTTLFILSLDGACLSQLATADAPAAGTTGPRSLFVGGGIAYATFPSGYATIDVANPTAPVVIFAGSTNVTGLRSLAIDERGRGIAALGDDISRLDASDPSTNGALVETYATPGTSEALTTWAGRVLVADGDGGVQVVADIPTDGAGIAPTVSLVANDVVQPNRLFALVADASDDVRVRDVEFWIDGDLVATDGNFPFQHHVQLGSNESIEVTARAIDTGGVATVSEPFTITAAGTPFGDDPILAHDDDGLLYRVDVATGCTTVLGAAGIALWDIASNAHGEVFALGQLGTNLYRIDTSTFLASLVGPTGSTALLNSLTFDDAGVLWAAGDDELVTLDTVTGAASSVTALGGRQSAGDLAPSLDGRLVLTTTNATLVAIDTATFDVEVVALLPTFEVYALARTPSNALSAITASNQILTIDEETGAVTSGPFLSAAAEIAFTGGASFVPMSQTP